jgi:hypothetical protein
MDELENLFLLSYWGTILSLSEANGAMVLRPLYQTSLRFRPLSMSALRGQSPYVAVPAHGSGTTRNNQTVGTLEIISCSEDNTVSLKASSGFATAHEDLSVSFRADRCGSWETFLPISSTDLKLIQNLYLNWWEPLSSPDQAFGPMRIGVSAGCKLHLGHLSFNLKRNIPLSDECNLQQMQLRSGEKFEHFRSIERSERESTKKTIWISSRGNAGNKALQYLAAEGIRRHSKNAIIENADLGLWGKSEPQAEPPPSYSARTGKHNFWIDTYGFAEALNHGVIDTVILDGFAFHIDHYPPREVSKTLLGPVVGAADAVGFGADQLVCSVRGREILTGGHPDYIALPPEYYKVLERVSGLELVFFGQLGSDPYTRSLREAFPKATFLSGKNPHYDFETLRKSVNIAPSISTFSWLAAWLSDAESIYMPVGGMYHPLQHPNQLYLPTKDSSYRFILLPYMKAVNIFLDHEGFSMQRSLVEKFAREASGAEIETIISKSELASHGRKIVRGFDPLFYLSQNPLAVADVCDGKCSALDHYINSSRSGPDRAVDFDERSYLRTAPEAAMDIALGLYVSPLHHFLLNKQVCEPSN